MSMKRAPGGTPEDDGDLDNKRSRGWDRARIRILIRSSTAGCIIGRAGCNIKKLRADFDSVVRLPDCNGPERVLTIMSSDYETALKVVEGTLVYLAEEGKDNGSLDSSDENRNHEMRFLVHESIVGGVIGKGGSKIKDIREECGCSIKVFQQFAPSSFERVVLVGGNRNQIMLGLKEVFTIVDRTEVRGAVEPYNPFNFDYTYASAYGGYGDDSGRGEGESKGGFRGGRPSNYGGRNGFGGFNEGDGYGNSEMRGGYDRPSFGGDRGGREGYGRMSNNAFGHGREPFDGRSPREAGFGGQRGGYSQGRGGGGRMDRYNDGNDRHSDGPVVSSQVTITCAMAGAIIGPGGVRIRNIRADSGAKITIGETLEDTNERIVTIVGTDQQIANAQTILQQTVRENLGPDGF